MEMRYLFRVKRLDNGDWVQGYLIYAKKDCYVCENPYECMSEYSSLNGQSYGFGGFKLVDTSTICQCTGLKDKNGKLIFENDIVTDNVIYGVVKWDDVNARYFIDDREDGYQDYSEWWHEVKVIGNKFDNPELLEV